MASDGTAPRQGLQQQTTGERWGLPCVRAQRGDLAVEVVPELGAKVASITFRGRELLVQPASGWLARQRADDYLTSGLCGWDEMFPTIIGDDLPAHGELWSRPWAVATDGETIHSRVTCATVPVDFRRSLRMSPSSVVADYSVRNLSDEPVDVLWAAHPQFVLTSCTRLSADTATWVAVSGAAVGTDPISAPLAETVVDGATAKWWSGRDDRPSWVRLSGDDLTLELSWTLGVLSHVGVWVDMAALADSWAVSIQPSTSWHDDLHMARTNGSQLRLAPGGTTRWTTTLRVSSG